MIRLGRAVRHVERYSATDTRQVRLSRWPREELVRVGLTLTDLLRRETSGRMFIATFADHYLRLLDYSPDVLEALSGERINPFEAEQLALIKLGRLDLSPAESRRKRGEILLAHLKSRASGERLRRRANEFFTPVRLEGFPTALGRRRVRAVRKPEKLRPV